MTEFFKKPKIRHILCKICGKVVEATGGRTLYCKDCAKKMVIRNSINFTRKQRYEKRKSKNLKCKGCGCDLTNIQRARKYCEDCRKKLEKKWRQEYNKNYRAKHKGLTEKYNKEYYQNVENKMRHRKVARDSYRRRKEASLFKKL